jgi:hypothetical protein
MVTGEKNLRDFKTFPEAGFGIVGVFQKPVFKAFFLAGFHFSHDAGEKAHHGIQ